MVDASGSLKRPIWRDDEADVQIFIHGREEPLLGHSSLLRVFSSCAKDLSALAAENRGPPAMTKWDLERLVLHGRDEPVSEAAVRIWLNIIYSHRLERQQRFPLKSDLAAPEKRRAYLDALLFADAVGSARALLDELADEALHVVGVAGLAHLRQGASFEDAVFLLLQRGDSLDEDSNLQPHCIRPGSPGRLTHGTPEGPSSVAIHETKIAEGLEEALYVAGRLNLPRMTRRIMEFMKLQLSVEEERAILTRSSFKAIMSRRVLDVMPREILIEAMLRDTLTDLPTEVDAAGGSMSMIEGRFVSRSIAACFGVDDVEFQADTQGMYAAWSPIDGRGGHWEGRLRVRFGGLGRSRVMDAVKEVMEDSVCSHAPLD
jgi:hypothetical protein